MKIILCLVFVLAATRRVHYAIGSTYPTSSPWSPNGQGSTFSNSNLNNLWGKIPQGQAGGPWSSNVGGSTSTIGNNPLNNLWGKIPQGQSGGPWSSTIGGTSNLGNNPLNNLWNKIPSTSSTYQPVNNLSQSQLNNLWNNIPGGQNSWKQTSVNGVRCSNGQFLSSDGTSSYGGPTRFTCWQGNQQTYSDVCTDAMGCYSLVCRFMQCARQGGRIAQTRA
jgi:hypothetical protein